MTNLSRKIFSLGEIRYAWILLLSIVICIVTFFSDEHFNPDDQFWLSVSYYVSFTLAAVWSGANYVGHIRVNSLYHKQNDIPAYVAQLALNKEDKMELQNYLEDFAADLEHQGRSKKEAAKEAINQFKVKEFLSMSKHTRPFETHGHHYLMGYALLLLASVLLLAIIAQMIAPGILLLFIFQVVLAVYGVCFITLFMLYKVLDRFIYRKLKQYFS
ncbi:hypothetical protein OIN60_14160 [Paenibacillus sp. P96]|uniref:DUF4239 domain-containing protein n=1 Tax=Paenibacillus zeirhizosphaerae TaxID=2987519 RepID=A0ABT9FTU6_9BACL|nr:hypothetical protein [Paenibacillus sp. P96]MDP4097916.1 hypothetical protein [Paenibacillus sp. P96]